MGVSLAKLIIYNIVLLFICHNKRSSSSSSSSTVPECDETDRSVILEDTDIACILTRISFDRFALVNPLKSS